MEKRDLYAYVKYPLFDREKSGELAKARFRRENFPFDPVLDQFTCPQGRALSFIQERTFQNPRGYEKTIPLYQAQSCQGCTWADQCKKSPQKHRRFILRERRKAYIEYGLLAMAHNLRKIYCEKSGIWVDYYDQRAQKKAKKVA